jgi:hypothetical protein
MKKIRYSYCEAWKCIYSVRKERKPEYFTHIAETEDPERKLKSFENPNFV